MPRFRGSHPPMRRPSAGANPLIHFAVSPSIRHAFMSSHLTETRRRRSFAIVSHPDAGKTTLTEKLLLFGGAIQMAGSVKSRKAARHATSDWMALEKERGISVTSSVMQFPYNDAIVNLLDTSAWYAPGAAVAPAMGKMTRAPLRFLLALANVRLGVWVPNPTRVQAGASYRGLHRRPGLSYLAREMAGSSPGRSRYVYVSDGGHFDNLGLVELLARRCDWIFTIDASGDAIDTFGTLGCALAIAEAELGITVDISPVAGATPMQPIIGAVGQLIPSAVTSLTGQPWCVQVMEKPRNSPSVGWVTTTPTSVKMAPEPTGTSAVR